MKTIPGPLLDQVVGRLVAEFDPEQIILFGSHAWGVPHEDSDLDLLVIVARSEERPIDRAIRAHRCLGGIPVSKDVLVRTRAEVDRFGRVPASLEAQILSHGRILYGRGEAGVGARLAPEGIR